MVWECAKGTNGGLSDGLEEGVGAGGFPPIAEKSPLQCGEGATDAKS